MRSCKATDCRERNSVKKGTRQPVPTIAIPVGFRRHRSCIRSMAAFWPAIKRASCVGNSSSRIIRSNLIPSPETRLQYPADPGHQRLNAGIQDRQLLDDVSGHVVLREEPIVSELMSLLKTRHATGLHAMMDS
jgi:hypothetical protein